MKPIIKKYASKDLNIAYNDGYETAKREVKNIIDTYDNYPSDIFPFLKKKELQAINDFTIINFDFPLDRLSAHLMRLAQENIKEELKKQLNSADEKDEID